MPLTPPQKITALYAAYGLCVVMTCLPDMTMQNVAAIMTFILLAALYLLRSKWPEDSLEAHHTTFIIRTIWIWSAFLILGMIGAGMVISQNGDMSALDQLSSDIANGMPPTEDAMNQSAKAYFETNYDLILKTTLMWLSPAQIYAVWRIARGLSRALKGYRLSNIKSWF